MAKETKKVDSPATSPVVEGAVDTFDWSQAGPTGMENVTQQDLGIPFLTIVQKGSPQYDESDPDYALKRIEGVKVGDIINTVGNHIVWSKDSVGPLVFIPCFFDKLFVEWVPKNKGGGFVKSHRNASVLSETTRDSDGHDVLKNGNHIVTTSYFYGIVMDNGEPKQVVIGLSSTQAKKAKMWLNMAQAIKFTAPDGRKYNPPLYSHTYHLTSTPESNKKGSWMGWQIRLGCPLNDKALIELAVETSKSANAQRQMLPPLNDDVAY